MVREWHDTSVNNNKSDNGGQSTNSWRLLSLADEALR